MPLVDVKSNIYIDSSKEVNDKNKNKKWKLVILLEYQNIKMFLQKVTLQIGLKTFLWLKTLKIVCHGYMLLMMLMVKKLFESVMKTNGKKQIKYDLELKN